MLRSNVMIVTRILYLKYAENVFKKKKKTIYRTRINNHSAYIIFNFFFWRLRVFRCRTRTTFCQHIIISHTRTIYLSIYIMNKDVR